MMHTLKDGFGQVPLKWSALALSLLLTTSQSAEDDIEVEWFSDLDIGYSHNNNVGQAQFDRDIIEDNIIEFNAGLIANLEWNDMSALTLTGFLKGKQFDALEDLSSATAGFKAALRWQFDLGFFEPFYQLNHSVQIDEYDDVQRDSTVSRSQFFMTKRLNESFTLVIGAEHFLRDSDGTAFDLYHNRLFFNLDYDIDNNSTVYTAVDFRQGEIVSTAQRVFCNGQPADDIFPFIQYALAGEPDYAFRESLCGEWIAYKLEADTTTATIGYNMSLTSNTTLDVSVTAVESKGEGDIEYDTLVYGITYLVRF